LLNATDILSFIFGNDVITSELYNTTQVSSTVVQYLMPIFKGRSGILWYFYDMHPVVCCKIDRNRILPEFLGVLLGYILQKCIRN
jgi:hypothetical protein